MMTAPGLWPGGILFLRNGGRRGIIFHINLSEDQKFQFMPDVNVMPTELAYDPVRFPRGGVELIQRLFDEGWRMDVS